MRLASVTAYYLAAVVLVGLIGPSLVVSGSVSTRVRSFQREIDGVLQPIESVTQHGERIIIDHGARSLVEADVTADLEGGMKAVRDKIARAHNEILGDANKGYFDPHNHNSGIIHWLGTAFATEQGNAIVDRECRIGGPGTMSEAITNVLAWINLPPNQFFGDHGLKAWDTAAPMDLYCFSLMTTDQLIGYRVSGWKDAAKVRAWFEATAAIRSGPNNIASPAIPISGIDRARKIARDARAANQPHDWTTGAALFNTLSIRMMVFKKDLLVTLRDNVLDMANVLAANPGAEANRAAFSPMRIGHNSQTAPALVGCINDGIQGLNGPTGAWTRTQWRKLSYFLENLLSASPLIDYDSSYVIRNYIMEKSPGVRPPIAARLLLPPAYTNDELEVRGLLRQYRFALQQLIDGRITYVELSATPGGVPLAPPSALAFQASQQAFEAAIIAGAGIAEAKQLYTSYALYSTVWYHPLVVAADRITVKFLVMGLGKLFAAAPAPAPGGQYGWYRSTSWDGEVCLLQTVGVNPAATTTAASFLVGPAVPNNVAPWNVAGTRDFGRVSIETMLSMPHIIGLDFASPEHHCMGYVPRAPGVGALSTRQHPTRVGPGVVQPTYLRDANTPLLSGGYTNLVALVTVVNRVASAGRGKRLQFHVHNGEAYPIFNKAAIFPQVYGAGGAEDQDELGHAARFGGQPMLWSHANNFGMNPAGPGSHTAFCAESVRSFHWATPIEVSKSEVHRNPARPVGHPEAFFPVHYARGRTNVIRLAAMIRNIQLNVIPTIDKRVRFRFGHATHADLVGARAMREANIGADINLSSNLATLALVWNQFAANQAAGVGRLLLSDIDDRLEAFHARAISGDTSIISLDEANNLAAVINQGNKDVWIANYLAYALADHGIWNLIAADVDVYLGTDGSGTEHSGHKQDHIILKHMVRAMLVKTRQRAIPSPLAKERMRIAAGVEQELLDKVPNAAFITQSDKVAGMTLDIAVRSFIDSQFYQRAYEYVNWINIGA